MGLSNTTLQHSSFYRFKKQTRICSMNKSELVANLSSKADISKADATKFLNAFTETVKEALAKGDKITLVGFGTFSVNERPARQVRNPRTGEKIDILASKFPKFKVGAELKTAVN
jgi:DNA-binding protein HU-beta